MKLSYLLAALLSLGSLSAAGNNFHISNAHSALKNRNFSEAKAHLERALQENPANSEAIELKGHIAFTEGRKEEAIQHLSKSIETSPSNANLYFDRGVAHLSEGHTQQASKDIRKALEINPKLHARLKTQATKKASTKHKSKLGHGLHTISMKKGTVKLKKGIIAFRSKTGK